MPLNSVPLAGLNRFAMLIAFALPLGCFTGADKIDDDPIAEGGSETDATGGSCELATEGCPCTAGGGCDPGLECVEGACAAIQAVCGNGELEADEICDDGNTDNTDSCTTLCAAPSCTDGILSGDEFAADCGATACGIGCDFGQTCLSAADCTFPSCGPSPDAGPGNEDALVCELPTSCKEWLASNPTATDNIYAIDPDGAAGPLPAMDVFCHMGKDDGGWTLIFVSSDDGTDTWTWNDRAMLAGEPATIGSLNSLNLDFMSPAYHALPFTDVLFIHQPSNVWAHYADVSDGVLNMGEVVNATASPTCDPELADNGFPLVGGTLSASGLLCDTDLYFNLGDHDGTLAECMDLGSNSNTATFGPVWSGNNGDGCPFDDPADFGVGPQGPCGQCPAEFSSLEFTSLGYGNALSLNSAPINSGENYLQMYVR